MPNQNIKIQIYELFYACFLVEYRFLVSPFYMKLDLKITNNFFVKLPNFCQ